MTTFDDGSMLGTVDELITFMISELNKTLDATNEGAELESEIVTLSKLYNLWHTPTDTYLLTWDNTNLWKLHSVKEVL